MLSGQTPLADIELLDWSMVSALRHKILEENTLVKTGRVADIAS